MFMLLLFSHSVVSQLFVTPWTAACQTSLFITISQSLLKLMSIESLMPSNHLILFSTISTISTSPPFLFLPSILPSIRIFSNELGLCIRWPKYWSFGISPSNKYSGLISFRIDWFLQSKGLQESSPTPLFKNINSLALSLLYGPHLYSHICTCLLEKP